MGEVVTVVSAVDPYPMDAGKKVVLGGFLRYLSDRFGPANVHYLLIGGNARSDFPVTLHPLARPRRIAALGSAIVGAATGRASLQESFLRSAEVRDSVRRHLDDLGPTLEIYDTVRTAQYAPIERARQQICYLDDLFSERYGAMLSVADRYPDVDISPLGNFATHIPGPLRPLVNNRTTQRSLLRTERRLVTRSEDRAVQRFRRNLLVSEGEADLLRRRTASSEERVRSVPPLVRDTGYNRRFEGKAEFVFLGLLDLPHNDDGVCAFLSESWPSVLLDRPDARLRIVGRRPSQRLSKLVEQYSRTVTLDGYVDDLDNVLSTAAAMLNPLRFGSGIKLKVIEALARGVPVISTPVGAEGIASGAEHGILVAQEPKEFAAAVASVADRSLNDSLSTAAREHFERRYQLRAVYDTYDSAFRVR